MIMHTMDKYNALYKKHLIEGADPKVRTIFDEQHKKMVHTMGEKNPAYVDEWTDNLYACIEGKDWEQFLTHKEAEAIMAEMNPAAKWTIAEIEAGCTELGVISEKKPYWNLPALAAVMNMEASDHAKSTAMLNLEPEKEYKLIYMRAVEKLEDSDGIFDIREYFLED